MSKNSKRENSTTKLILFLATFSLQKASNTVSKWQLVAIKVCIISAFSTTTKGLKRPFKNPSHMRICNNLERALVSDIYFYFHLANVRHYYENARLSLSEYSACFNKGLLTLETCWRKFKLQIPEISGFSYVFSSYYRTTNATKCQ